MLGNCHGIRHLCQCYRHRNDGYLYFQKCTLVNAKLKWVKDKELDAVVADRRNLRAATILVSLISSSSSNYVPIYRLNRYYRQLDLPDDIKLSTFMRKYPNIFDESSFLDSGGTRVPSFGLTPEVLKLYFEELEIIQQTQMDAVNRLQKLFLLTRERTLPLHTVDQLKWDMGLPFDYHESLVPRYPQLFSFVKLGDERIGLKLLSWDEELAVSYMQRSAKTKKTDCSAFPIGFTRGFGLKKKYMEWLEEWQKLPYTSPYVDALHLDRRTDVSEKRIVGVFHELLHLTLYKNADRKNVSNLRKPLDLPQKFTKAFERHPGVFYISKKSDTQTVILREAYDGNKLIEKHPLVAIRERFTDMMKEGFLDRSRGLYKNSECRVLEERPIANGQGFC